MQIKVLLLQLTHKVNKDKEINKYFKNLILMKETKGMDMEKEETTDKIGTKIN